MTPSNVIAVGDGFHNLRGKLVVRGILPVGTQASLVRRKNGKYLLLDAIALDDETRRWVLGQTDGGRAIEAVLHLHPFHTIFVRGFHEAFPHAKLYGTARHRRRAPDLKWETERTDDAALHEMFADDLAFTVPRGVHLIPANENLHFSSVLAFHPASKTLHVDDTLNFVRLPFPFSLFKNEMLGFHPTLAKVLEERAGAANDFRDWVKELVERLRSVENLCAAHTAVLLARDVEGPSIADRVKQAARSLESKLAAHAARFG
jgi:hypothetical protein